MSKPTAPASSAAAARSKAFDAELLVQRLELKRYALALTRAPSAAEDLIQETLVKAMAGWRSFAAGTDMGAWLRTIMRNTFISAGRKAKRDMQLVADIRDSYLSGCHWVALQQVDDADTRHNLNLGCSGGQVASVELGEVAVRLDLMSEVNRAALWQTRVLGETCEEAASRLGVAVGTVKSRIARAHAFLMQNRVDIESLGLDQDAGGVDVATLLRMSGSGRSTEDIVAAMPGASAEAVATMRARLRQTRRGGLRASA